MTKRVVRMCCCYFFDWGSDIFGRFTCLLPRGLFLDRTRQQDLTYLQRCYLVWWKLEVAGYFVQVVYPFFSAEDISFSTRIQNLSWADGLVLLPR
jgi:hypothetical protein